jgi:hypothetical protein
MSIRKAEKLPRHRLQTLMPDHHTRGKRHSSVGNIALLLSTMHNILEIFDNV